MKKTKQFMLALSSLMILGGANAFAQRTVDLEPSMDLPASGTTITNGDAVHVKISLTNNGPDDLAIGDSIFYAVPYPSSTGQVGFGTLTQALPAGQSLVLIDDTMNLSIDGLDSTVTASFCFRVFDPNTEITMNQVPVSVSYNDNDTSNNTSCVSLTVNPSEDSVPGDPNAIAEVSGNGAALGLYPNPASSEVNFKIDLQQAAHVTAVIRDITGREVLQHSFGTVPAGNNVPLKLNVSDFVPGMYIVELQAGDKKYVGKVTVRN